MFLNMITIIGVSVYNGRLQKESYEKTKLLVELIKEMEE